MQFKNQNSKIKIVLSSLLLLIVLFGSLFSFQSTRAQEVGDLLQDPYFGGMLFLKQLKICWIAAGIFPVPVPFQYNAVGRCKEGESTPECVTRLNTEFRTGDRDSSTIKTFYHLFLISQTKDRKRREKSAYVLGNMIPQGDDAFRQPCKNKAKLPNADGLETQIGTGCKYGEEPGQPAKCKV
ncbi:MAG: hypothetical protein A3C85_04790 [Candidatus Doudnabacteria bacterium RIFCSPHIGHO2_02_FULL_48_21]|uniref:Uncharacterized protein n=1 Tax=Candidatus Doudnabacteria bacterium RIFCSPLOWO2_02_FULL_48_13 TaxID=1817845 RepID=A0A1F5QCI7_9BACT|nr:MAG: hypothetical protein A3K05_02305 [Candidatus Doudnabacteria bacterium RIFCSPHIGHO2_01_48_18]OGE90952.1 MAG: hypothetical protein A3F44_03540 [Candidatus Doudnabacteria bacterium RIFCSPHIGHO2_12_FULL_47_25]OGE92821.1 MAG: hypothetical protein A3C85_04790 [Candidatus Doudnabacteria bacterium RIFCSPHIGHO2_02_FULL_48_21]OGE98132.1 MAG: hypothetical protein A3A83_00675 [Candidatus Doudnabacteria bacterium RIFCSPLOWO2_01_FULL_48_57]OGE99895.1 MAG: hypothetical protein A3J05_03540 [Candidatus 